MSTIEEKLLLLKIKIDKVKSDRTSIISAIIKKGINVPSNALLEDLPAYIMMISGGSQPEASYVIDEILYIIGDVEASYSADTITFNSGAIVKGETLHIGSSQGQDDTFYVDNGTLHADGGKYEDGTISLISGASINDNTLTLNN